MKRLLRLVVGLMVGIGVLALSVRGIAQAGENADRCVHVTQDSSRLVAMIDAFTGQLNFSLSNNVNGLVPLKNDLASDGLQRITSDTSGNDTRYFWERAFPKHRIPLGSGSIRLGWWLWSPDNRDLIYVIHIVNQNAETVYSRWYKLDTVSGYIDTIQLNESDQAYLKADDTVMDWSLDGRHIVVGGRIQGSRKIRLFILDQGSTTPQTVDVPELSTLDYLTWLPDGKSLLLTGEDAQKPTSHRLVFYWIESGRFISHSTNGYDIAYPFVLSPNERYFYVETTDPATGSFADISVYGVDGSAFLNIGVHSNRPIWSQFNSHLVFDEPMSGSTTLRRLMAFDPATGKTQVLAERLLERAYSYNYQLVLMALQESEATVALDSLNLQTGTRTRLLNNITRLEPIAPITVLTQFLAVRWYAGEQFHLSFIDASGQLKRDFTGLEPGGSVVDLGASHFAVYLWTPAFDRSSTTIVQPESTFYLLDLDSGNHFVLYKSAATFEHAYLDTSRRIVYLEFAAWPGTSWRTYTLDGKPVPSGFSDSDQEVALSPDRQHAVRWYPDTAPLAQPSPIELLSESGAARFLPRQGIDVSALSVAWSADGAYFALKYADSSVTGNIRVDVFTAGGDLVNTTAFMTNAAYNQIEWGRCG